MKRVTESSGNVFADLGLPDPDGLAARAELTRRIVAVVRARALSQRAAAKLLGLRQPDVSLLLRGRWTRFSTDRLLRCLRALGQDVRIVIRPKPRPRAPARLIVAGSAG